MVNKAKNPTEDFSLIIQVYWFINHINEVKGKRADGKYISTGWIKPENVSLKDIDVAVAKYAGKNDEEKLRSLKEIVDNTDFSDSYFVLALRKVVMDMETRLRENGTDADDDTLDIPLTESTI